ncbi:unnamed protein product [Meloidogyne enterolobii]|uniref:Uncharacterized protein n=1 Tax=Meloidogyne enterolobii TaxID=390850 RepID=A0ACB0ZNG4_MELEN
MILFLFYDFLVSFRFTTIKENFVSLSFRFCFAFVSSLVFYSFECVSSFSLTLSHLKKFYFVLNQRNLIYLDRSFLYVFSFFFPIPFFLFT